MTDLFLSPSNFWFSIALSAVFLVLVMELAGMLFGVSLIGIGDEISDIDSSSILSSELASWMNLNRVPFLVWLVVFLTTFGAVGFIANSLSTAVISTALPPFVSVPVAFVGGLLLSAKTVVYIARIIPSIESSAVSADELVGSVAEITIGRASRGNPAEAKFTDNYAQPHFVLVEPFEDEERFAQGERVILVQKNEHSWLATRYL